MTQQIVLASNNSGKLKELRSIFSNYNVEIISQAQFGEHSVEETGLSFIENAILKARHGCAISARACIADDSGLEVQALQGQPGIYSARFAGKNSNDDENIEHLLNRLKSIPSNHRQARFRCVMVYLQHADDPAPIVAQGIFEGFIIDERRGNNGFGYDPVFYIPDLNKTCAQLSMADKNKISHRARATRKLVKKLMANEIIKA